MKNLTTEVLEQHSRNQSFTRPLITTKLHECISIFTANLLIVIMVVFGGTGTLTKLKRNLSVNKPASPTCLAAASEEEEALERRRAVPGRTVQKPCAKAGTAGFHNIGIYFLPLKYA
jgi:hypothetical protein